MFVAFLQGIYVGCPVHHKCEVFNKLTLMKDGLGYLKILAPPEKVLRWIERKLNLLGRLPHYVSIDQKTYGRYGVPTTSGPSAPGAVEGAVPMTFLGSSGQRTSP